MWNRKENETSTPPGTAKRERPATPAREFSVAPARAGTSHNEGIVNIGQSICIRGELTGNEDLTLEGKVDGKIDLKEHNLTIGPGGKIQAEITARTVSVQGEVNGNITASERVELAETGRVRGDIVSPRIVIADGARFKGSVDMSGGEETAARSSGIAKPLTKAQTPKIITDGPPADSARAVR